MKKCPYCAEEIQDEAVVCRYCGRDLKLASPQVTTGQTTPAVTNQKAPAKKRHTLLIGALLFTCLCCGVFGAAASAGNSPTTPTPEIITKGADGVIESTHIPLATNTTEPTNTPMVTQESQLAADPYFLKAQEKVTNFTDAYFNVSEYMLQAADDTSLIFDEDWKRRTGVALGILNLSANEMAAIEPTPVFETYHSYVVELAKETHLFTDAYARGIDNFDADSINAATVHLGNMTTLMQNATLELESINNSQ